MKSKAMSRRGWLSMLLALLLQGLSVSAEGGEVSGQVLSITGSPVSGIEVHFWREGAPGDFLSVETDATGVYVLNLEDGIWRGAACGAEEGYAPLFWEATVIDGQVTSFSENDQLAPVVDSITPETLRSGEEVTVIGEGFGCSGKILLTVPILVSMEVTEFIERDNTHLRFVLPDIPPYPITPGLYALAMFGCGFDPVCVAEIPGEFIGGPGDLKVVHGDMQSAPVDFSYNNASGTPLIVIPAQIMIQIDEEGSTTQQEAAPTGLEGALPPGTVILDEPEEPSGSILPSDLTTPPATRGTPSK